MSKKVLIIGGVAGGASLAARLRRLDEDCQIVILEKGEYISFANCGLPYFIGGVISDRDKLLLSSPEAMKERFNIEVRVNNEVMVINKEAKEITVKNLLTNEEYQESYDVLAIATGSRPLKPKIEGIESNNIFNLWNMKDMDKIVNYIKLNELRTATVVGGGFIGIEMAENLKELGLNVNLVEMADQVMAPLDKDMASMIHEHLYQQGINLYLDNGVNKFINDGKSVELKDGTTIDSDLVILSIGIRPNSQLAIDAGLAVNERKGIIVDDYLVTSDPNIYALGDVVEITDFNTKEKAMVPLAAPANKQGRIAANNICGRKQKYVGAQKTSVVKVFDLTVANTGENEKSLNNRGLEYGKDYLVSYAMPKNHAGYYPEAYEMTIKLIFDLEGEILGGQCIGFYGVDKRIDVIATSMHFKGTIYDLQEIDLAYAPPFGSAKDPVNMVAFAAENILRKDVIPYRCYQLESLTDDTVIIDVRTETEYEISHINDAINIPVDDLRSRLNELSKDKNYLVYCAVGLRGYIASRILMQNGFECANLIGGYTMYKRFNYKVENVIFEYENKEERQMTQQASVLDCSGMQCPGPIMQLKRKMDTMATGEILEVISTDFGFTKDSVAWCKKTGNKHLGTVKNGLKYHVKVEKMASVEKELTNSKDYNGSTMVVFSGDLDKAIASLIIANGAAAMGKEVSMFFTFWGLNILRKSEHVKVKKSFVENAFGKMMPRGIEKLGLSNMNMMGMGSKMMKYIMKKKNVLTLAELMAEAQASGVKMIACTMSMDVLGIQKEELIDGIEYGGVAAYLGDAENSNHNLFI